MTPKTKLLAVAMTLLAAGMAPSQTPDSRKVTGVRRALLIGIDRYEQVSELRGCVNDVRLMAHILRTRYGFTDIRLLTDEQATRKGILQALRRAVRDTGPTDALFVHYSGHGSYIEDVPAPGQEEGDEADGYDETLVPQDGRGVGASGEPVPDITDDELDRELSRIRTENLWIFFDACHSRDGTRATAGEVRERSVPPDRRKQLYARQVAGRAGPQAYDRPHVLLTSAAENEKALDGPVDGIYHGLFSRALATVLARQSFLLSARETWQQAGEEYCRIVERLGVSHRASSPMLQVGRRQWAEAPFLPPPGPGQGARLPWLTVRGQGKTVLLLAAKHAGAARGSEWTLFPADDRRFAPRDALAWGKVVGYDGEHGILRLSGRRKGLTTVDGCRAVEVAAPALAEGLRVKVRATGSARKRIVEALTKAVPSVAVVPDDEAAAAPFLVAYEDGQYRVFGGDAHSEIGTRGEPEAAARILTRSMTVARLLALQNPSSAMSLRVWTDRNSGLEAGEEDAGIDDRDIEVIRTTGARATQYRVYRPGDRPTDRNCLLLNLRAEQDCYITVVNVDAQGQVNLLFPNRYSEEAGYLPEGRITAFETVRLPDRIAEDNQAGYNLALKSAGKETIRVLATEDLDTARQIRATVSEIRSLQTSQDLDPREAQAQVALLLADLRAELLSRTRGIEPVPTRRRPQSQTEDPEDEMPAEASFADDIEPAPGTDWTASSLTIVVGKED